MTQPTDQPPTVPGQPYPQSPAPFYQPSNRAGFPPPPVTWSPPPIGANWAPQPPSPPAGPSRRKWLHKPGNVGAVLVVLGALIFILVHLLPDPADDLQVSVTGCTFTGAPSLPRVTAELTVKNAGSTAKSARVDLEYRDGAGNRIDTDTAYIGSIAPGDTVRHEEVTYLNATAMSGTCAVTAVS